jgi:hypothetical protein
MRVAERSPGREDSMERKALPMVTIGFVAIAVRSLSGCSGCTNVPPCTPAENGLADASPVEALAYTPPTGCRPISNADQVITGEPDFWAAHTCFNAQGQPFDAGPGGITSGIDFAQSTLIISPAHPLWSVRSGETITVGYQLPSCSPLIETSETLVPATPGGAHVIACTQEPCHCGGPFEEQCPL